MNDIRKQLFIHSMNKDMKISDVRKFICKRKGRVIRATLYIEYIKVCKFKEMFKLFQEKTPFCDDIIQKILIEY